MQVWKRTSRTKPLFIKGQPQPTAAAPAGLHPWLCTPLEKVKAVHFHKTPFKCNGSLGFHVIFFFLHNPLLSCLCTSVDLSVGKGRNEGWDGTKCMGFEALRGEPDTSVKIYSSAQKQARESGVGDGQTRDCTDESMYVQLFRVVRRKLRSGWGEHSFWKII